MAFGQELASFYATIGADSSGLQKGLEESKKGMTALQSSMNTMQGMVSAGFVAMGAAAVGFATAIATTGIQFDAMKEQAQVAFTTMLGSGQAAQGMLDELQAFAAKTPFEFPDLIRASQRLMAMGIQAQDVIPTLTAIGDAVAAMGGSSEMVDRVTTALGQMNAKGKVSAEEMNQLTEAGIPVWQMLADKIGTSVPDAMKKVSGQSVKTAADSGMAWKVMADGVLETVPKMRGGMESVAASGVSAATAISAITEGIETRFGGMMEKQSTTWNGIISNIKDGFAQMSGSIMQPFFDMAKVQLGLVAEAIGALSKAFHEGTMDVDTLQYAMSLLVPQSMIDNFIVLWEVIEDIVEVMKAILRPINDVISKFVKWQDVLIVLGSVLGVAVLPVISSVVVAIAGFLAPITAAIAAVAALRFAWDHDFLGIKTITKDVLSSITKWFDQTGIWKGSIKDTLYGPGGIQPSIIIWSNSTKNRIADWIQWGKDKFNQWKGDIIRIVTNWKDIVVTTFGDFVDPVMDIVGKWAIWVRQEFEHFIGWFTGDIGGFATMKRKAFEIWNDLLGWWKDHIQPWVDYGRDIVMGLWNSIKYYWGQFVSWFTTSWNGLVHKFQEFFGINSPSTLFATYGENMMQGLANGIDTGRTYVDQSMAAVSNSIDSIAPKLRNYYLDLLNAKNAALQLASMPKLPDAPVLYHTPPGGPANGSDMPLSPGGAVHPVSGGPQYKSLSTAIFDLFGVNSNAVQQITSFASNAYKAITAAGPLQGSSAAALAYKEIGTGNAGSDTVGRVISAIMTLIGELQSRGVDNQVNTKAIQQLVDALSRAGGGGLSGLVSNTNGLR